MPSLSISHILSLLPKSRRTPDFFAAKRKQAYATLRRTDIPEKIEPIFSLFTAKKIHKEKNAFVRIIHSSARYSTRITTMERATTEEKKYLRQHAFSTFRENNLLHNLFLLFSPAVFFLDIPSQPEPVLMEIETSPLSLLVIRVHHNAHVTIIERKKKNHYTGLSGIEVFGNQSNVSYIYTQNEAHQKHVHFCHADMKNRSNITWYTNILGGNMSYNEVLTTLNQSTAHLYGTYLGTQKERFYMDYQFFHTGKKDQSLLTVQGVNFNTSHSYFTGNIHVSKHAQNSTGSLSEHCLLLSSEAKHSTLPVLEMNTNDVSAHHSASVSQIDKDHLFYLTSRGIGEREAKKLIVQSFLEGIYSHMRHASEIQKIESLILGKISS